MKKKDFLKLTGLTDTQFNGTEKISGYLYLSSVTSIPEGFNPTVGGSLYLSSVTSIPEGFNPTVGGSLYLRSTSNYIGAQVPELRINKNFFWKKDDKEYALIDGIFCEVLAKRDWDTFTDSPIEIFEAKSIAKNDNFYVAHNKEFYSHGKDLKEAVEDLRYKIAADKLKKEPITAETIVSIEHYRAITGACREGCRMWLESNNLTGVKEMKASELLPLLKKSNAYGYEKFKQLVTF